MAGKRLAAKLYEIARAQLRRKPELTRNLMPYAPVKYTFPSGPLVFLREPKMKFRSMPIRMSIMAASCWSVNDMSACLSADASTAPCST